MYLFTENCILFWPKRDINKKYNTHLNIGLKS